MVVAPDRILGDKYRLVRPLSEGGMGSVWLAEHLTLASPVAVKLIAAEVARTPYRLQRFLREARTAAASRGPHVVQILDHGVDEGTPYIVMELLEGESLAQRLARVERLSPRETELVIRQVGRALSRAHETGIVHRDLKPANIFITHNEDDEIVKLFDFGIAKSPVDGLGAALGNQTRTGSILGTPYYMSPEQLEASRRCDHRTDVWAMGVIAFECLIGHVPFTGGGIGGLVLAVCTHPLPVPSQHGPVPDGFDGWFARACARELEQRFSSAREAANELRRLLEPDFEPALRAGQPSLIDRGELGPRSEPAAPVSLVTGSVPEAPAALPLPSTTSAPSSRTLDAPRPRTRARLPLLLIPLIGCITLVLALRLARRPTTAPETVLQALEPPRVTAGLTVLGEPGLQLEVDGRDVGPLPSELRELEPGEHVLRVLAGPRYHPLTMRVSLEPGRVTSLGPVELEVATGLATITLGEGAEGAEVSLKSGESMVRLPPLPMQLDVATDKTYSLVAHKDGYAGYEEPLAFEKGHAEKTFVVRLHELSRAKAKRKPPATRRGRTRAPREAAAERAAATAPATMSSMSFLSTPNAAVVLDGAPLGTTPLRDVGVEPGPHRVIFILGSQRKSVSVTTLAGKRKRVTAKFATPVK